MSPSSQRLSASSTIAVFVPGIERHLGLGIELDAVDVAVPARDRLLRLRQAADRRIAVDPRVEHGLPQSLDDVRRRPRLRVSAPEIDERLAVCGSGGCDAAEEPDEVLLRQPIAGAGGADAFRDRIGRPTSGRRRRSSALARRPPTSALTPRRGGETSGHDPADRTPRSLRRPPSQHGERARRAPAPRPREEPRPARHRRRRASPSRRSGRCSSRHRRARAAAARSAACTDRTCPRDSPRDRSVPATARAARPERAARCACARVDRRRVTLLGIVFFFVLAVDRGWIGPRRAVTLGAAASAALVGAGALAASQLRRHVRVRLGGRRRHRRLLRDAARRGRALRPHPGAARIRPRPPRSLPSARRSRSPGAPRRSRRSASLGAILVAGPGRAAGRPHGDRRGVRLSRARGGDRRRGAPQLARSARRVGRRHRAAGARTRRRQACARAPGRDRVLARLRSRAALARAAHAGSRTCRRACSCSARRSAASRRASSSTAARRAIAAARRRARLRGRIGRPLPARPRHRVGACGRSR